MRRIESIEKLLSETSRPVVRDGPHRAALKRELLGGRRETTNPVAHQEQPGRTAGAFSAMAGSGGHWIARRRWIAVGAAAAAAVVVVASVGIVLLKRHPATIAYIPPRPARPATATAPSAPAEASGAATAAPPATRPALSSRPLIEGRQVEGLRRRSLSQSVAEANVIVVGTALDSAPAPPHVRGDLPENFIRFRVLRVLKGQFEQEFVTTRTPTNAAEFIGRDWVIMLSPEFVAGRHAYAGCYTIKLEPEIKGMVDPAAK